MKFEILTLFPEAFDALRHSVIKRAEDRGAIEINVTDIRAYSDNKHRKVDDAPFGGGAGMVMTCQPLVDAIEARDPDHILRRIYLSPRGRVLTQKRATELAAEEGLLLVCGHYEGIDERVIELCIDEEISIGDYVLTGGELPAMVLVDCVSRYVGGVLKAGSTAEESFAQELLEYPQYTRPEEFRGLRVPEVLLSGDHKRVDDWRYAERVRITKERRPDLIKGEE